MSVFTPSGSAGATSSTTIVGSQNPTILNLSIPLASTEVSYSLPAGTKKFYIQLRDPMVDLQLAYVAGASGTTYVTVHRGTWYGEHDLSASGVTLYLQTSSVGQTAEIVSWT